MPFITQGKTNWKFLVIVIILAIIVGGGALWYVKRPEKSYQPPEIKKSEVESSEINLTTTKFTINAKYLKNAVFSKDGKRVAYILEKSFIVKGPRQFLVLDEEEFGPYDELRSLSFSPDGERFSFFAEKEGKWFFVLNGEEKGPYQDYYDFDFSPDSKRYAFITQEGLLILDGKELGPYDMFGGLTTLIYNSSQYRDFLFSPDSKRFSYVAEKGDKWFLFIDEKEIGSYDSFGYFTFSPDSKRFAYQVQKEGKWFVFVDGEEFGPYDDSPGYFIFSPDSKRFAFQANKGGKGIIVLDGKEIGPYDTFEELIYGFEKRNFLFSPDSKRFAYQAQREGKWFVILDEKEFGPYPNVPNFFEFTFSPDSKRFAYIIRNWREELIVVDGKEIGPYYSAGQVTFSPDSKSFVFYNVIKEEKEGWKRLLILDGKESDLNGKIILRITFSPDSKHLAYAAYTGKYTASTKQTETKYFLILDGKEVGAYSSISTNWIYEQSFSDLTFSPDSKHFVYDGLKEGKRLIILDGKEIASYDGVYMPFSFDSESKHLYYGALINNELWWIVNDVENPESSGYFKKYSNETLGYEFRYPNDWVVDESDNKVSIYYPKPLYLRDEDIPPGSSGTRLLMTIDVKDISLEDFIKNYGDPKVGEKITNRKNYDIDGVPGAKLTGTTALGPDTSFLFVIKNNKSYIINFHDGDPFHTDIISTFRFIEEEGMSGAAELGADMKVLMPNGGEEWKVGENHEITWESHGMKSVNIYVTDFSYFSGTREFKMENNEFKWDLKNTDEMPKIIVKDFSAVDGNYLLQIPNNIFDRNWKSGDYFKIYIFGEANNGGQLVRSDNYFSITK